MFSLRDLRFVLCSRDIDVLRAQRIMGFFSLITHKSTRSESPITWTQTRAGREGEDGRSFTPNHKIHGAILFVSRSGGALQMRFSFTYLVCCVVPEVVVPV